MTSSGITALRDQSSHVRRLRLTIIALILSNILLGAVSVMLLRRLNARYTDLINRTVPTLNDLRSQTTDALAVFRTISFSTLHDLPEDRRHAALEFARAALAHERKDFSTMLATPPFVDSPKFGAGLAKVAVPFEQGIDEFIRLYSEGKISEAAEYREATVRPAFDRYLGVIALTAGAIESSGLKDSDALTETTGSFSRIMIALASWPLLLIAALLVFTLLFLAVLMIAFCGRDLSDAP